MAFGGPAAHIAMFRDEVVTRRKWISNQHFLDLLGATNLIPGPNSSEMALHVGYVRAGWRGLLAAGLGFALPATLIVLVLAVLYVGYGTTPAAEWLLYGIKPVVIAIIAQAMWGLLRTAVKGRLLAVIGAAVFASTCRLQRIALCLAAAWCICWSGTGRDCGTCAGGIARRSSRYPASPARCWLRRPVPA